MPKTECAYGFSCASMMMEPGLQAVDCPNRGACGTISNLTEDERVELIRVELVNGVREYRRLSFSAKEAALLMLMSRGCPQNSDSLGLTESIQNLRNKIFRVEEMILELTQLYVAPIEIEAHAYNVKRPYGTYQYNKLTSKKAIFEPSDENHKVKVIHLSKNRDERNVMGRYGIETRNRLLHLKSQVDRCQEILEDSLNNMTEISINEAVTRKIDELEEHYN